MEKQPFQVACPMKDGDFPLTKKPDVPIALVAENFGEKTDKFPKTTSKEPELPAGEQWKSMGFWFFWGSPWFFF